MKKINKIYLWIIGIVLLIPLFPALFAVGFTLVNQLIPAHSDAGDIGDPIRGEGIFTCSKFGTWSHGVIVEEHCTFKKLTEEFYNFIKFNYEYFPNNLYIAFIALPFIIWGELDSITMLILSTWMFIPSLAILTWIASFVFNRFLSIEKQIWIKKYRNYLLLVYLVFSIGFYYMCLQF